jgi:citrate synthase
MASSSVSKAVKVKRAAAKTSIPADELKAVKQWRGFMISDGDEHATNEQAYQLLLRGRKHAAAQQAKEQETRKKNLEADKRRNRERAIETLGREIMHLADIRALLERMEKEDDHYFCAAANATFARAALSDAGAEMEQALVDLGVLQRGECGYFVPALADELEAQAAA